jgi:hypothetical protein
MSLEIKVLDIVTWNVKRAGYTKSTNDEVMDIYYKIFANNGHLRDIIILQEVVDKSLMEKLGKRFINSGLPYRWDYIDALNNGEYYVVIYNRDTVGNPSTGQYNSRYDMHPEFHRPPMIAYFGKIDLAIINLHTKPPQRSRNGVVMKNWARNEIQCLENVVSDAKVYFGTQRTLIGGDLNWCPPYYDKRKKQPFGMKRARDFPGPDADTTTSKFTFEPYDHFIIDDVGTARIIRGQVLNFKLGFRERLKGIFLPQEYQNKMMYVSDHWPVEIKVAIGNPEMNFAEHVLFYLGTQALRMFNNTKVYPVR